MVSYVWTSCTKYVKTLSNSTSAIITKSSAPTTLRQSLASWSQSDCLSLQTLVMTWWRLFQTFAMRTTGRNGCFVGAITERNCNQCKCSAILTKKNTRISRPSVLFAGWCYHDLGSVISLIVALGAYLINRFAGCYA